MKCMCYLLSIWWLYLSWVTWLLSSGQLALPQNDGWHSDATLRQKSLAAFEQACRAGIYVYMYVCMQTLFKKRLHSYTYIHFFNFISILNTYDNTNTHTGIHKHIHTWYIFKQQKWFTTLWSTRYTSQPNLSQAHCHLWKIRLCLWWYSATLTNQ